MDEDPTRGLPGHQTFEERVFAGFEVMHSGFEAMHRGFAAVHGELAAIRGDIAALDARLTTLEERVDARLQETRPIWEAVQLQITRLDEKFEIVIRELYEVRTDTVLHGKRLDEIERRLNS